MWSIVDFKHPIMAATFIERSKSALVDLRIGPGCSEESLLSFSSIISRCTTIESTLTLQKSNLFLSHLGPAAAPQLRWLDLKANIVNSAIALPQPFSGHVPSPVGIRLSGFALRQTIGNFSNLIHLIISNDTPDVSPPMTQFLDVLQSSPKLKELTLESAGPRATDGDPNRIVDLKHLQVLTLIECPAKVILQHLSLPGFTDLITKDCEVLDGHGLADQILPNSLDNLKITSVEQVKLGHSFDARRFSCWVKTPYSVMKFDQEKNSGKRSTGFRGSTVLGGLLHSHYKEQPGMGAVSEARNNRFYPRFLDRNRLQRSTELRGRNLLSESPLPHYIRRL